MKKQDLYIIAAGKGSRLGGSVPKALVPITNNEPCLTTTLQQVANKFENVFVVINIDIQNIWAKYIDHTAPELLSNVTFVPIKSGLGDGHAVMVAIEAVNLNRRSGKTKTINEDIVICWGDVFFPQGEIMDELCSRQYDHLDTCSGLLPCVKESSPYVTLLTDLDMNCIAADFSKYGESHPSGFHDQSVFRFKRKILNDALRTLHASFWKSGRYITPGGELSLLHAFHYLSNILRPCVVYETDYPTMSFNTVEEVADIQKEINAKWQNNRSSSH